MMYIKDGIQPLLSENRALKDEIARLKTELEEAKQVKLEGMQHPAWHMFGEFTKFMEDALAADCPMVTDWRVKIHETGEDVVVLNIWAATSHESPITRCRELRVNIDAANAEIEWLREGLQSIVDFESERWMEHCDIVPALKEIAMNTLEGGNDGNT